MKTIELHEKIYKKLLENAIEEGYDDETLPYYIMEKIKDDKPKKKEIIKEIIIEKEYKPVRYPTITDYDIHYIHEPIWNS